jgi:DNA-binding MarR family transcriptional regulator
MSPAAADRPFEVAGRRSGADLGWSLAMVLRRWQERVEETLSAIPHGSRGYHVLTVVVHDDLPTQGALASRLAIDRTVLTYLIDDLEAAGLVERQLDRRDRRARRVVATEKGRQLLAEADRSVAETEERVLGGLAQTERAMFRDAAERAAEAIHATAPQTDPCLAVQETCDPAVDTEHRPL